jgi:signal transduction histidine kinase/predicted CoA-binding protein
VNEPYEFLKKIPMFAELPEADLERLCQMVTEIRLPAGAELFSEGSPGDQAYVIKEGQIEIVKSSNGREVLLAVRQAGEVIGEMSLLDSSPRFATGRARNESLLLAIRHEDLDHLLNTSPSAAKAMLYTFIARLRSTELILRQSEKMAQLGTLTAGIAHELNNPASAARRGAEQLQEVVQRLQASHRELNRISLSEAQESKLADLDVLALQRARQPVDLGPLDRSDREEQIETWLEDNNIEDSWDLAPTLVRLGYQEDQLQDLLKEFDAHQFKCVIQWLEATYSVYELLEEIHQGATRIGEIVKALKTYVYLDQAPVQSVDIHEGLDNTLVMLRSKLKKGVVVHRQFAPNLPRIQAFGSELNQVWTNIIDNAIDAMDGEGEITLRTRLDGEWVVIEIEDNGSGIPEEIQSKIFSPFFTTKPVGKGTGLGLNISYNIIQKHGGEIKIYSHPGMTRFDVRLPLDFGKIQPGQTPVGSLLRPDDEKLGKILHDTHDIAVVGISNRPDAPAHSVPAYLQQHGYHIIPVNPKLDEVLGEQAYPDLNAIPEPVDLVLIFRRSEFVPDIVNQAIHKGAKVVWMQEGIINQAAAEAARQAGLIVVMDTCMRATHKRLVGRLGETQ